MGTLTKEELIFSFRAKNTKRRDALYNYYKAWFDLPLTATMLAQRISLDLGIPIRKDIIYHIRSKHKPSRPLPFPLNQVSTSLPMNQNQLIIPELTEAHFRTSAFQFLTD